MKNLYSYYNSRIENREYVHANNKEHARAILINKIRKRYPSVSVYINLNDILTEKK